MRKRRYSPVLKQAKKVKIKQIQKKNWGDIFAENVNLSLCCRKKNEVSDEILQNE